MHRVNAGGKADANQAPIVRAMEKVGASVIDTSAMGGGFPDLVVGFRGAAFLLEVKNPATSYGRRGFNPNQKAWNSEWRGPAVVVVLSVDDALRAIGALK